MKQLILILIVSTAATSHALDYRMTLVRDILSMPGAIVQHISEDGEKLLFAMEDGRGGYYHMRTHQVRYIEMLPGESFSPFRITADGTVFGFHMTADFTQRRGIAIDLNTDQRSYFDYVPAGFDAGGVFFDDVFGSSRLISTVWDGVTGGALSAIYTKGTDGQWTTEFIDPVSNAVGFDEDGNIYGSKTLASIWDPNLVRQDLITWVNGYYCYALGRLPDDRIVGKVTHPNLLNYSGICIWDNEQSTPVIQTSIFEPSFTPTAVSPTGTFAFYTAGGNTQTYLWDPFSGLRNLKDAVIDEIPGTEFRGVDAISDSGKFMTLTNRGWAVIEPVPEPGTLAVLGLGLVPLLRRKRKPK